MDPITKQTGIAVSKDSINAMLGDWSSDPFVVQTSLLISGNLKIAGAAVTDESIQACMRLFQHTAKQRKLQFEILELVLGQLRVKHNIMAKPCSRIFISQPELTIFGASNVPQYRMIERVRAFLRQDRTLEAGNEISLRTCSVFFLHLVFNERISDLNAVKQIFSCEASVQIRQGLCWLNLQDGPRVVSELAAEFYRAYRADMNKKKLTKICQWLGTNIFDLEITIVGLLKTATLEIASQHGVFAAASAARKIKISLN